MKYIKPELKFEVIQQKEFIASGLDEWLVGKEMADVQITTFYVAES